MIDPKQYASNASEALRNAGVRAKVFRCKQNPLDFDYSGRPKRTRHHCEALGRMTIGPHAWVWFEYDEREHDILELLKIAEAHHVRVSTTASPYNPALYA